MSRYTFLLAQAVITLLLFINVEAYLVAFFLLLFLSLDLEQNESWIVILIFSASLEAFSLFGFKIYDLTALVVLLLYIRKGLSANTFIYFTTFIGILSFYAFISLQKGFGITDLYGDYLRYFFCFIWFIAGYVAREGIPEKARKLIMLLPWVMVIQGAGYLLSTKTGLSFGTSSFLVNSDLSGFREGEVRVAGLFTDPNKYYITWYFVLAIFLVLFKPFLGRKDIRSLLLVTLLISFISLSRTAILVSVAFSMIVLFIDTYHNIRYKAFILIPGAVVALAVINMIDFNQLFFDFTYTLRGERVSQFSGSLEAEKRFINWLLIFNDLSLSNLLIGNGLVNKDFWGENYLQPPHNTLLGMAYQFGVVLSLLFLYFYIRLILPYKRLFIPIAFLTIMPMMVLDLFGFRLLWLFLAVLLIRTIDNHDNHFYKKFWT